MANELDDIELTEILFLKKLFSSAFSVIFLVNVRNQQCIMKVHHGRGPRRYYEPENRELDIHVLESTAYTRLKERGLCDRGIVPNYLGAVRKFDPSLCQPHLKDFLNDEYLPSAIFLEYIVGLEMISLDIYTQERMDNFVAGIRQIHKAFVRHRDPKPRNMMVVKDTPDRVVWLDFDRAETYDEEGITSEQARLIEEEQEIVTGFKICLVSAPTTEKSIAASYPKSHQQESDYAKGKLDEAYNFYCT
ncbi:uncharacterized protein LDX57_012753 [Aspergillus melleus]|uniref:uncharacterized protein n=1 Tax=Aspergillus melleus TaxID=138277 RepID=UPI001E8DA5AD|nr:uncharacterized protein LDX57_012753 [Aspergillus melleus]KAH8435124.1 hypothetical protein LDX57_012753 [Aspergillus melleus]